VGLHYTTIGNPIGMPQDSWDGFAKPTWTLR
jgi:hypothetical protein